MSESEATGPVWVCPECQTWWYDMGYHRMRADLETKISHLEGELWEKKKLITKLCDALEWYVPLSLTPRDRELLQHARDATK